MGFVDMILGFGAGVLPSALSFFDCPSSRLNKASRSFCDKLPKAPEPLLSARPDSFPPRMVPLLRASSVIARTPKTKSAQAAVAK